MHLKTYLLVVTLLGSFVNLWGQSGGLIKAPVFTLEQTEKTTYDYRIPSLVPTNKGTLLAFAERRHVLHSDHAQNDIVLRRSFDGILSVKMEG